MSMPTPPTERAQSSDRTRLHDRVRQYVNDHRDEIISISHQIFDTPQLAYEETFAHDLLSSELRRHGFEVTEGAYELDTAFEARAGLTGPTVAIICEYDALPGIGHACGHNIIAASGFGAALAVRSVLNDTGGSLRVLGTPAEEGGGGKIRMLKKGALQGIDMAMMIHPAGWDLTAMSTIAVHQLRATYRGTAAHAAAAPERGVNALDGAVLGYLNVAALRQHISTSERIHGVFTHGGDKPNIVPDFAETLWYVRSGTIASLRTLGERVERALTAGALAAGAECSLEWLDEPYADMIDNQPLLANFADHMAAMGRPLSKPSPNAMVMGSTDMGNVSYEVPSIHPMIRSAPTGTAIHTTPFADNAADILGDEATVVGATAMALSAIDFLIDESFRAQVTAQFVSDTAES